MLAEQKAYCSIWLVQMEVKKDPAEEIEEAAAISSYQKQAKPTAEPVQKPAGDASSSKPPKADKVWFLLMLCLVP